MEKTIMIVGDNLLLIVGSDALIMQKWKHGAGVYWSGVCGCCGWGRPGSVVAKVAEEHGFKLYTGETLGVRDVFGEESAFALDDLVPFVTEEQIRTMAAIPARHT